MVDLGNTAPGKITGGAMLARALRDKGTDRVFSLCGGFINPIYMGCLEYGIEVIGTHGIVTSRLSSENSVRIRRRKYATTSVVMRPEFSNSVTGDP